MTPKGSDLEATDLLEVSTLESGSYVTRSITGQEIIDAASSGVVTSVTGTAPIASSGGTTPAISIATANTSTAGALSSTDWNTFNGKQDALVSGTNIKTVNSTSLLGSGDLAVQATLVSGTNIKTINGTSVLGSGNIAIASGITIGTTAITSGTVGRVLFQGTGNVVSQSANLFFDATNNRLGINTSTPTNPLSVYRSGSANYWNFEPSATGTAPFIQAFWSGAFEFRFNLRTLITVGGLVIDQGLTIFNQSLSSNAGLVVGAFGASGNASVAGGKLQLGSTTDNMLYFQQSGAAARGLVGYASGQSYMQVRVNGATDFTTGTMSTAFFSTGNIGINTTTDAGYKLDVNGTARVATSILVGAGSTQGTMQTGVFRGTYFNDYANNFTIFQVQSNGNASFYQGLAIGTSSNAVASAQVEIVSTTKGFLPPRMTTTQKNAIATPAAGLMVYDTTLNVISYYNGTSWI